MESAADNALKILANAPYMRPDLILEGPTENHKYGDIPHVWRARLLCLSVTVSPPHHDIRYARRSHSICVGPVDIDTSGKDPHVWSAAHGTQRRGAWRTGLAAHGGWRHNRVRLCRDRDLRCGG